MQTFIRNIQIKQGIHTYFVLFISVEDSDPEAESQDLAHFIGIQIQ